MILGETVNISRGGILFVASETIPLNATVGLQIEWPIRSFTGERLHLAVHGQVVRSVRNLVAARIRRARLVRGEDWR